MRVVRSVFPSTGCDCLTLASPSGETTDFRSAEARYRQHGWPEARNGVALTLKRIVLPMLDALISSGLIAIKKSINLRQHRLLLPRANVSGKLHTVRVSVSRQREISLLRISYSTT